MSKMEHTPTDAELKQHQEKLQAIFGSMGRVIIQSPTLIIKDLAELTPKQRTDIENAGMEVKGVLEWYHGVSVHVDIKEAD